MSDRERLEQAISNVLDKVTFPAPNGYRWGWAVSPDEAERRLKAAVVAALDNPPAPPPELEVTEEADKAFCGGYDKAAGFSVGWNGREPYIGNRAAGYRAAFPHLLRSCADGLTDEECEAIAAEIGMTDGSGLIRTILRRVAARREA